MKSTNVIRDSAKGIVLMPCPINGRHIKIHPIKRGHTKIKVSIMYNIYVIFWVMCVASQGIGAKSASKLRLLSPPRPPRIYTQAPAGVGVTEVKALYDHEITKNITTTGCDPRYSIVEINQTDFTQFTIDECDGVVQTARYIDRNVGEWYRLVVRAMGQIGIHNETEINIRVTIYNEKPPFLTRNGYSEEIFVEASIGTLVTTLGATDEDDDEFNRELFYSLQNKSNADKNPWLMPNTSPIGINFTTGEIRVTSSLFSLPSPLLFYVGVSDGGSPQRSQTSEMTLNIRYISAPRNVEVVNTSESTITICWRPPLSGVPEGFLINYSPSSSAGYQLATSQGNINMTAEEILQKAGNLRPIEPIQRQRRPNSKGISRKTRPNPLNVRYCIKIEELQAFSVYAISVMGWSADGGGISLLGGPVNAVTRKRDCSTETCERGVCQEQNAPPGFVCKCMKGYAGDRCQHVDLCSQGGLPCDHGKCHWSELRSPTCVCDDSSFFGPQCQWTDPCQILKPCKNNAKCIPKSDTEYLCNCQRFFTGPTCKISLATDVSTLEASEIEAYCPSAKTVHFGSVTIPWPKTPSGIEIRMSCPYGEKDVMKGDISEDTNSTPRTARGITRMCKKINSKEAQWLQPNLSHCLDPQENNSKGNTDAESAFENEEVRKHEKDVLDLIEMTSIPEKMSPKILIESVNKLSAFVKKAISKQIAVKVAKAISNMLSVDYSLLASNETGYEASSKILSTINEFTANIVLKPGDQIKLKENNLVIEANLFKKENIPNEVSFQPFDNEESSTADKTGNTWLKIPKEALEHLPEDHIRIEFTSYTNDNIFRERNGGRPLNMPVLSAIVRHSNLSSLSPPISYTIPVNSTNINENTACVFWDTRSETWSTDGLKAIRQNANGQLVCESTHLTAFSVLLDPNYTPNGAHSAVLSVITYVGLALSTVALIITIATFALFKSLSRDRSGVIVMNLSIALLLLNISFIFASTLPTNSGSCLFFAAILHYSVAASFAWMLIEALNMYQLLVTVFPSVETHFTLKRLFIGWGAPIILVCIALSWDYGVYTTKQADICVMSPATVPAVYYTTYFAPICLILTINCVVFILVTRVLCQRRPGSYKQKDSTNLTSRKRAPVTIAQVRGAITVVALLGVTWIASAIAVGPIREFLLYIFCITTPLQGFTIFMVRVIQSAEARTAWYYFLTSGSRHHRKGPLSSQRTHSSSQQMSSTQTQSTGMTPPTSVFVSAMRAARRFSLANSSYISSASSFLNQRNKLNSNKDSTKKRRYSTTMLHEKEINDLPPIDRLYMRLSSQTSQNNNAESNGIDSQAFKPYFPNDSYTLSNPQTVQKDKYEYLDIANTNFTPVQPAEANELVEETAHATIPYNDSNVLIRTQSDLLQSISGVIPLINSEVGHHCSLNRLYSDDFNKPIVAPAPISEDPIIICNGPQESDISKSVLPYQMTELSLNNVNLLRLPNSQLLRSSSEMAVYVGNDANTPSLSETTRLTLSNNNLEDIKRRHQESRFLNPD